MKCLSAVTAVLLALALSGCMTSPPPDPNAIQPPAPGQGGTDSPKPPGSTCTNSASGATGINTCKEIERMGGLLNTFLDLGSLGFSMSWDRAQARAGTSACPNGGTTTTGLQGGEYRTTLTNCDFGLGAFNGTVESGIDNGVTSLFVDVRRGSLHYVMTGQVIYPLGTSIASVTLDGILSVGSAPGITANLGMTVFSPDKTLTFQATHYSSPAVRTVLQSWSQQEKAQWATLPAQWVRFSPPPQRTVRYERSYFDAKSLRNFTPEGIFNVSGDAVSGPLTDNNKSETLTTTWTAMKGSPRYDFAD